MMAAPPQTTIKKLIDVAEVRKSLSILVEPGQVFEVRVLEASTQSASRYTDTLGGYFDNADDTIRALSPIRSALGFYITLQRCHPDLLGRACNKLIKLKKDYSTPDNLIMGYKWLPIDSDPERISLISSTDAQHEKALAHSRYIREELRKLGWPEPLFCDSGNGAHLPYRIDLANTPDNTDLLKRVLEGIATRFDIEGLHIDKSVFNPSRIWKLYGTLACKGDDTAKWPHRMSRILEEPALLHIVTKELLEAIAAPISAAQQSQRTPSLSSNRQASSPQSLDNLQWLEQWIRDHNVSAGERQDYQGGYKWPLPQCPFCGESDHNANLFLTTNGFGFHCSHNRCNGIGWQDFRTYYEPDAYTSKSKQQSPRSAPVQEQVYSPILPTHSGNGSNGNGSNGSGPVPTDNMYRSFNLTDLGNAERLVARFGRDLRYCHDMKAWLTWNITQWKEDKNGHAERIAKKVVRLIYKEAGDVPGDDKESEARRKALASHAMRSESKKFIRDMLELAKSEEGIPIRREDLDADPWLLNCSNGTIDLHTGTRQEHKRSDFITRCIATPFNPDARCPLWLATLETIFNHNPKLITFFKRALGYALTGDTSEQCFFLLYGKGHNGKSTLLEVILSILGDYAQSAEFKAFLSRDNEGIRNDIARMSGKRLVIAKEADKGKQLAEALIKQLTGGDTITARFLHQEYFDFKPQFKLFLAANHKPEIKGTDLGIWRRVRLIPFEVTIPEPQRDKDLPAKLLQEAEGILAWLVEGCLEWQREGLGIPEEVKKATEAYRTEMDTITHFISENCILETPAPGKRKTSPLKTSTTDLVKCYEAWCEGEKADVKQLKTLLNELGYFSQRGTGGRFFWQGVELKEPEEDNPLSDSEGTPQNSEGSEGSEPKKGNSYAKSQTREKKGNSGSLPSLPSLNVHSEYYLDMESWLVKSGKPRPPKTCTECGTDAWWPYWQRGERTWGCATCNPSIVNHR